MRGEAARTDGEFGGGGLPPMGFVAAQTCLYRLIRFLPSAYYMPCMVVVLITWLKWYLFQEAFPNYHLHSTPGLSHHPLLFYSLYDNVTILINSPCPQFVVFVSYTNRTPYFFTIDPQCLEWCIAHSRCSINIAHNLISSVSVSHPNQEGCTIISPIFHMRRLRPGEEFPD